MEELFMPIESKGKCIAATAHACPLYIKMWIRSSDRVQQMYRWMMWMSTIKENDNSNSKKMKTCVWQRNIVNIIDQSLTTSSTLKLQFQHWKFHFEIDFLWKKLDTPTLQLIISLSNTND